MKFKELLLELNLYNRQPLIDAVNKLLYNKRVTKPEIKNWFLKQYVNWYLSSTDDDDKVYWNPGVTQKIHTYKEGEPEWAKKQGIYDFIEFNYFHEEDLKHTIDYFEQLDDVELKKIYKQPYEIVTRKVDEWDEFLINQKALKDSQLAENVDYKTILPFQDGYKFIQLVSKKAYDVEGNQMGHCAASYADRKSTTLFSLKDPKGISHVTIEYIEYNTKWNKKGDGIVQIKGKENAAPVKKYIPYIKAFIEKTGYPVLRDGSNIGMIEYSGYFYFKDSRQWLKVYNDIIIPKQYADINEIFKKAKANNGKVNEIDLHGLFLEKLPDFSNIQVEGNFYCDGNQLTSLQGAPQTVGFDFDCSNNQLTSLQGAPQTVGGNFICNDNQLTSLQGAPKEVRGGFSCIVNQLTSLQGVSKEIGGSFYCSNNQLTSLQGAPQTVGFDFDCGYNQLTSLQGAPQTVERIFKCNNNQLTSLKGAPQTVRGFNCSNNQLTSLQGAPQTLGGNFICNDNQLTSLQGAPQTVGGSFYCSNNQLTSLQGAPKVVFNDYSCGGNKLTSLQGAPEEVGGDFHCEYNQLTSLKGAPQRVGGNFACGDNSVKFTINDVKAVTSHIGKQIILVQI